MPSFFAAFQRLWFIFKLARAYGLGALLPRAPWFLPVKPTDAKYRELSPAGRLRLFLEALGPVWIKLGQALSTRPDLLPPEFAMELAKLQDNVPPFSGEIAQKILTQSLQKNNKIINNINEVFIDFNPKPLAAASIAQVHCAQLFTGQEVVVKILRPNIKKQIEKDLKWMGFFAKQAARYLPEARRLKPQEVIAEYEKTIFDELDLLREAGNASQLGRNWLNSPMIIHPKIYFDYCDENILVMEKMSGLPVNDLAQLRANNVNIALLAERGVEIFFKQVFRDNFFHADMHPGNILVDIQNPDQPKYIALDFGIVGSLLPEHQKYLAENFLAFFNRDYRRVAALHIESGWVHGETRLDEFESAIRTLCEPIMNKPLAELSFGQFLLRLFQTARRFNMEVQPPLVLLQKTLLNIEGLGRQLYPELDLWKTAKPILEEWFMGKFKPKQAIENAKHDLPHVLLHLPLLLQQAHKKLAAPPPKAPDLTLIIAALRRYLLGSTLLILGLILFLNHQNIYQEIMVGCFGFFGLYFYFKK